RTAMVTGVSSRVVAASSPATGACRRLSVSVAVLFAGVGSGPAPPSSVTAAWLVIAVVPAGRVRARRTVSVRVATAPAARSKAGQVTTLETPPERLPPPLALTNAKLAGRVSVNRTPVAPRGPTLVTVRV